MNHIVKVVLTPILLLWVLCGVGMRPAIADEKAIGVVALPENKDL